MIFDKIGVQVPRILLPKEGTDLRKWSVIACDQYTSDQSYWHRLEEHTKDLPSTLNLVFPEVYLNGSDADRRIDSINRSMEQYLADGSLVEQAPGFVLVDRQTRQAESRKGLILALDLEQYDYSKGAQSLIRTTEGTILDRLPPRVKVRENAPIEVPHIMVLIDDPGRTVIEPLFDEQLEKLYDFDLLENGGHLTGYRIDQPRLLNKVATAIEKLADPAAYRARYQVEDAVMLYAMGDGNHSFATAKTIWEKLKSEAKDKDAIMDHPARYALVELVNLHDPGLTFEPIHRMLFDVDVGRLQSWMEVFYAGQGTPLTFTACSDLTEAEVLAKKLDSAHAFVAIFAGRFCVCSVAQPVTTLVVATLQACLDNFLQDNPAVMIDYIHGTQPVTDLGGRKDNAGFYLPAISKDKLFKTIVLEGATPRKTFSLGEADEKRYYLECRRIR